MRKEARREGQQRDEELEEVRCSYLKKIKVLECQLETEHEERTFIMREKHELERLIQSKYQEEQSDHVNEEINSKLKKDIRKYKALLKDVQMQLDHAKTDSPSKAVIRQLRHQVEDLEASQKISIKVKQSLETEMNDLQVQLDESNRNRHDLEDKLSIFSREKSELQTQIEENEEELSDLIKKYSIAVKQLNLEQVSLSEYEVKVSELELEKLTLKDQLSELNSKLENIENLNESSSVIQTKR